MTRLKQCGSDLGHRIWLDAPDEMQAVLDDYFAGYDHRRAHKGRNMNGRTRTKAFADGLSKPNTEKEKSKPKSQTKIDA